MAEQEAVRQQEHLVLIIHFAMTQRQEPTVQMVLVPELVTVAAQQENTPLVTLGVMSMIQNI